MIHCKNKIEEWRKILNSNKETNVLLKTGLSNILKNKFDREHLDTIEEFQTRFIEEDQWIELLRKEVEKLNEITEQAKASEREKYEIDNLLKKLENDISKSALRFDILKNAFNHFRHRAFG